MLLHFIYLVVSVQFYFLRGTATGKLEN